MCVIARRSPGVPPNYMYKRNCIQFKIQESNKTCTSNNASLITFLILLNETENAVEFLSNKIK